MRGDVVAWKTHEGANVSILWKEAGVTRSLECPLPGYSPCSRILSGVCDYTRSAPNSRTNFPINGWSFSVRAAGAGPADGAAADNGDGSVEPLW